MEIQVPWLLPLVIYYFLELSQQRYKCWGKNTLSQIFTLPLFVHYIHPEYVRWTRLRSKIFDHSPSHFRSVFPSFSLSVPEATLKAFKCVWNPTSFYLLFFFFSGWRWICFMTWVTRVRIRLVTERRRVNGLRERSGS